MDKTGKMKQIEQMYHDYYKKKDVKDFYINERIHLYHQLVNIVKMLPAGNVVDIGCGMGGFIELLNDNRINALGIDFPIEDLIEYHKKLKCNSFIYGSISDGDTVHRIRQLKNSQMNSVVSIIDTLRHIDDRSILFFIESYKPAYLLIKESQNSFYMRRRRRNEKDLRLLSPTEILGLFDKYEAKAIYTSKFIVMFKNPGTLLLMLINLLSPSYTFVLKRKV